MVLVLEGSDIVQEACVFVGWVVMTVLFFNFLLNLFCLRSTIEDYALPSSTFTAWGLMAPVRGSLVCPAEVRESWSLLVIPPVGTWPSPTAMRTSRTALHCAKKKAE